jgi:hypothetical protein
MYGAIGLPVAFAMFSLSSASEAALAKSPLHAQARPS